MDGREVSGAEIAARAGLRPVDRRPGFGEYLAQLWQRRAFIRAFAGAKMAADNSRSRLGQTWQVLDPVLTMAVYWFLFGFLLGGRGTVANYTGFLAVGVFAFALIRQSTTAGARSITNNLNLVRAIRFPRAALPIALVVKQLRIFMISVPVMIAILLITGEPITWNWLLAPLALVLIFMFSMGLALILARVVSAVDDVSELLPYFLRLWGYASGVMIPIVDRLDRLGVPPWAVFLVEINPPTVYLDIMRDALMGTYDSPGGGMTWLIAALWAVVILPLGLWLFWRGEGKYGRD